MGGVVRTAIPRHVVQRKKNDCAIATVAMTANLPYEHIAEQCPVAVRSRVAGPTDMHRLLVAATGVPWYKRRRGWLRPIAYFATVPDPVIVLIRRPWKWNTRHWVAIQGGWIHDPEFPRGLRAESYPRRHWRTISVLRPESALRLMFVQHFRS
jgi:hypothetical protein